VTLPPRIQDPRLVNTSIIERFCDLFSRLMTTEAAVSPLPITHTLWATCMPGLARPSIQPLSSAVQALDGSRQG